MGMNIEGYLRKKKPLIDREIEEIFPRKTTKQWLEFALGKAAFAYDTETVSESMAEPIWEFLDRGGKRWRPALALLCCEAVGGDERQALPFTPLVELTHSGTIMVDDLEDDSKERRGKPCAHLLYGTDIACNDSNALYFLGLIALYRNTQNLPMEKRNRIYDLYSEELLRVCIGQAMDILWHKGKKRDVSEQEYLQMAAYKTGVLARFAAKLGAILGNGTQQQIDALGKFGESLGMGFQIQDDILELTEKRFQKGKGIAGGDIHEGKRSLLVIKALWSASPKDRKRLLEILDSHTTNAQTIKEAIAIIEKYGTIDYAKKKAMEIIEKSWREIDSLLPKSNAKQMLKEMAEFAIKRKI